MDILKYYHFNKMNENLGDTPEEYVKSCLTKIKSKIEKMFGNDNNEIDTFSDKGDKEKSQNFSEFNLELQSCEISTYSKTTDNVKAIYQDDKYRYDLIISINLEDAVPKEEDKEDKFSDKDIKECNIVFKAYDLNDFNLIGKIEKRSKIKDIDQDLLIKLKIEIDDEFGEGDNDEFKIETE